MSIEDKAPPLSAAGKGSVESAPLPARILLATDLSARCDRALDRAAMLAEQWHAELVALHATEDPGVLQRRHDARMPSSRPPLDPVEIAHQQLTRDLQGFAGRLRTIVQEGEPADVIARVAHELGCELVVTGLARNETLGRWVLGTTVDRLLRRTHEPVLVVHARPRSMYRNITVATDFSDASLGALRIAADFFPGQTLNVFHAYEPPLTALSADPHGVASELRRTAEQECAAFLDRFRAGAAAVPPIQTWIEPGHAVPLVQQFIVAHGVDLLVLGSRGRTALSNMIGGTAARILQTLRCDALVAPGTFRVRS